MCGTAELLSKKNFTLGHDETPALNVALLSLLAKT